jgi:hypothetical protein
MKKEILEKRTSHAFNKDIYLLGRDKDSVNYWLEAPSWDCNWYWGFGYVETYTNNNNPENARDINSHTHIDSSFMGQMEKYDSEKGCYVKSEFIHNIFDSPTLHKTTFTESEGWQLSELFKQFYLLNKMADFTHKTLPGCHITTSPVNHGDLKDWHKKINEIMIPLVTAKIIEILTPEKKK